MSPASAARAVSSAVAPGVSPFYYARFSVLTPPGPKEPPPEAFRLIPRLIHARHKVLSHHDIREPRDVERVLDGGLVGVGHPRGERRDVAGGVGERRRQDGDHRRCVGKEQAPVLVGHHVERNDRERVRIERRDRREREVGAPQERKRDRAGDLDRSRDQSAQQADRHAAGGRPAVQVPEVGIRQRRDVTDHPRVAGDLLDRGLEPLDPRSQGFSQHGMVKMVLCAAFFPATGPGSPCIAGSPRSSVWRTMSSFRATSFSSFMVETVVPITLAINMVFLLAYLVPAEWTPQPGPLFNNSWSHPCLLVPVFVPVLLQGLVLCRVPAGSLHLQKHQCASRLL